MVTGLYSSVYFSFPRNGVSRSSSFISGRVGGKKAKLPAPSPGKQESERLKLETALLSQAQIVNLETGELSKLNMPGELYIRGYCVMQGYWDEPQKTFEAIGQDKWYRTG